jgi:hypothetical protein
MSNTNSIPKPFEACTPEHPAFLAHMTMLQGAITRLSGNSSACKVWCLGLVTALLSLSGAARSPALMQLALMPVLVFALLDAGYLSQERRFRAAFEAFARKARTNTYVRSDLFEMRSAVSTGTAKGQSLLAALRSWSIWPVYGGLALSYCLARSAGLLDLLLATPPRVC